MVNYNLSDLIFGYIKFHFSKAEKKERNLYVKNV